ncbi:hypothetical protein FH972_027035 [Carpinus fangiana]|uniref:Uncharacterized protein n=1 Tax=Carpinus fangiana TaxID=176857 RepID=A0A5N6L633_9ROSI|nr:hypothetical protein FH972_027035 [Carpinus fangiana]
MRQGDNLVLKTSNGIRPGQKTTGSPQGEWGTKVSVLKDLLNPRQRKELGVLFATRRQGDNVEIKTSNERQPGHKTRRYSETRKKPWTKTRNRTKVKGKQRLDCQKTYKFRLKIIIQVQRLVGQKDIEEKAPDPPSDY